MDDINRERGEPEPGGSVPKPDPLDESSDAPSTSAPGGDAETPAPDESPAEETRAPADGAGEASPPAPGDDAEPPAPGEPSPATGSSEPLTCPNCGTVHTGPLPPEGDMVFCPSCDAVIPLVAPADPSAEAAESADAASEGAKAAGPAKAEKTVTLLCGGCGFRTIVKNHRAGDIHFCEKCNASLAVEKSPEERVVGRYVIEGEVARGGMAVVYRARHRGLNRPVALKVLLAPKGAASGLVRQLHGEAQAAAKLRHPNIVQVFDVGVAKGLHYIAMDLIEGKPLSHVLGKRRFKGKTAAGILKKVAEAIHYAHEEGLVHRDLKPSNILLEKGDEPRITDFGLAKDRTTGTDPVAGAGISGTPEYMSPEQARGSSEVDRRSDVFSLGAVLYALLTGKAPFRGKTVEETLALAAKAEVTPPRSAFPSVSEELEAVCLKAMAREKEDRYPSARAMAEDLDRYLQDDLVSASTTGFPARVLRKARRRPLVLAGAGAGLVLALLVILVLVFTGGKDGGAGPDEATKREEDLKTERDRKEAERKAWEDSYRLAQKDLLDRITQIKDEVKARISKAYGEMTHDPDASLTTLLDARALLVEMGDRVMSSARDEFRERLVKDRQVVSAAAARDVGAELDQAKARALAARGWRKWERDLDLDGARMDYDEAIKTAPDQFDLRAGRGMVLREAGLWEASYTDLAMAAEKIGADFFRTPEYLEYLLESAIRSGHGEEQQVHIDKVTEDGGRRDFFLNLLVLAQGRAAEALAGFSEATKKPLAYDRLRLGTAEVLFKTGKFKETVDVLTTSLQEIRARLLGRPKKKTPREDVLAQLDLLDALVLRGRAFVQLALAASAEDQLAYQRDARSDFREAGGIHPGDSRVRAGLKAVGE